MVEHRACKRGVFSALKRLGIQLLVVWCGVFLFSDRAFAQAHEERLQLTLSSGKIIWARVRFPELTLQGDRTPPIPAVMVFGGFQNAARVIDEVEQLGLGKKVILASFDYPFEPPRQFRFPQSLFWYPKVVVMLREAIEGVGVLAEALSQDSRIEPGIVGLGASLGAPIMSIAAARSPRISEVVLVHGFGRVPNTLALQLERGLEKAFGNWDFLARASARVLAYTAWHCSGLPAPEKEANKLRANQSVFWVEAENDSFVPKAASESLREAIRGSRARFEMKVTPGGHVQPGSLQLMRQIGSAVGEWLTLVRRGRGTEV
ncbi:hypothetical protein EBZ37_02365 [bacterium]|nr:hypothetical protein [bacterium]